MKPIVRPRIVPLIRAVAVGLLLSSFSSFAAAQVKPGQVALLGSQRVLINVTTGDARTVGYFTHVQGVPGPFFSGSGQPSDQTTAFFTFRDDPGPAAPLIPTANGPTLSVATIGPGTFSVYFNSTPPSRDFNSLADFATGELVARLKRSPGIFVSDQGSTGTYAFSADVVWSTDFLFHGETVNLRKLIPHGVTVLGTVSHTVVFLPPGGDFTLAQPAAFSALTMGAKGGD